MYVYGTCFFYVCCSDCVMSSAVLFSLRFRLLLYSAGSGVNKVQFVLSEFSVRLFCFVQAKTLCCFVFAAFDCCLVVMCI